MEEYQKEVPRWAPVPGVTKEPAPVGAQGSLERGRVSREALLAIAIEGILIAAAAHSLTRGLKVSVPLVAAIETRFALGSLMRSKMREVGKAITTRAFTGFLSGKKPLLVKP